jgi:hypothetical protein
MNIKSVIGFDGDGRFGYALYRDGEFVAGALAEVDARSDPVPADLLTYLSDMKARWSTDAPGS